MTTAPYRKKLIEVALPLAEINAAAAKEKSIRHGHPSTLHLWWARRPLAACRAVLFASLVDDPSSDPAFADKSEAEQAIERERLHDIIRALVPWENANNPEILARARAEILRSTGGNPPPVLDPFCGGGSIPLEAQRLGLEAHGSDLNPVAVLITKALIEIPPKFAGKKPVHPSAARKTHWSGAEGLAADVRAYGAWMRAEAEKRIGRLYPKARLPRELGGGEATVIAWLWARTVTCPNPACGAEMPLASSFVLSKKAGKQTWVEPFVEPGERRVRFEVRSGNGTPPDPPKTGRGAQFKCPVCGGVAREDHIRAEGVAGRMGAQLMAIVAEGNRSRVYLAPTEEQERLAAEAKPTWEPDQEMPKNPRWFSPPMYGLTTYGDLFTPRQLVALTTFSDLVGEARERALADARAAGLPDDGLPLAEGGSGATAYADAVATYLAFAVDRSVDRNSTICTWDSSPKMEALRNTFARQAIPMTWDFAEGNPFSESSGNWMNNIEWSAKAVEYTPATASGAARQHDVTTLAESGVMVATDPPYYDNIGYADLSDFFYVWLRRSLLRVHPNLFATVLVPKTDELIASPYRHDGSKLAAERFFEVGLKHAFERMSAAQRPDVPLTLFYAYKQREGNAPDSVEVSDESPNGLASTGWETMLQALIGAGFAITNTWPLRTELGNRTIARDANALGYSIVLVCRPRPQHAPVATRREFMAALRRELEHELAVMLETNVSPVDLAQATIGPGLGVFTRYAKVVEADGSNMSIGTALKLINEVLYQVLEGTDERLDPDTRFCIEWYAQYQYVSGPYPQALLLANARGVTPEGLQRAGVVQSGGGRVRILKREELDGDWDPATDDRVPIWEALQHLIARLEGAGVEGAGALLAKLGDERGEQSKQLAVRLYELCDRKRWSADAYAYNQLVREYPDIQKTIAEEAARYDGFVREYPQIQETAKRYREEQMTMF